MYQAKRLLVGLIKKLRVLSSVSVRLTKLTGKSKFPVHPKHLISLTPWFEKYLSKNDVVLDLGCGNGQNSLFAAGKVKMVYAVDANQEQLGFARRDGQDRKTKNVIFGSVDLEKKLPFANQQFDVVLFLDVLEHLNNRVLALNEVTRVLKKGGRLFLSVPNRDTKWKRLQEKYVINSFTDPDHKVEYTKTEAEDICRQAGLIVEETMPIVFDTPWAPVIDLVGGFSLPLYRFLTKLKISAAAAHPEETIGFRLVVKKH